MNRTGGSGRRGRRIALRTCRLRRIIILVGQRWWVIQRMNWRRRIVRRASNRRQVVQWIRQPRNGIISSPTGFHMARASILTQRFETKAPPGQRRFILERDACGLTPCYNKDTLVPFAPQPGFLYPDSATDSYVSSTRHASAASFRRYACHSHICCNATGSAIQHGENRGEESRTYTPFRQWLEGPRGTRLPVVRRPMATRTRVAVLRVLSLLLTFFLTILLTTRGELPGPLGGPLRAVLVFFVLACIVYRANRPKSL